MVKPSRPAANGFVRVVRKVYNPLGFSKGYNFVLFVIFFFTLLVFSLYEMPKINYDGVFCAKEDGQIPGECFWLEKIPLQKTGMIMHLARILPAGALASFQFLPVIRHKLTIVHRINGYLVFALCIPGGIGGIIISRYSFGGGIALQTLTGVATILFLGSMLISYINIKRLQLEQHRAWMLRAWFYATSIITLRFILWAAAPILGNMGYYTSRSCEEIAFSLKDQNRTLELYPECEVFFTGENPDKWAAVAGKHVDSASSGLEVHALMGMMFGAAAWLAFAIHAIGIEVYLRLTPIEHERLRQISYQRQVKAGMRHPGSAGLTSDRLGDAPKWCPKEENDNIEMDDTLASSLPTTAK